MLTHDAKPTGSTHSSPLCCCQRTEALASLVRIPVAQTDALTNLGLPLRRPTKKVRSRSDRHRAETRLNTFLQGFSPHFNRVDCLNGRHSGTLFAGRPITIATAPLPSSSTKTVTFGQHSGFGGRATETRKLPKRYSFGT